MLTQKICRAIALRFPPEQAVEVERIVSQYGTRAHETECERVQFGIVVSSNGSLDRVKELVALAKRDYRDLIMVSEYELKDGRLTRRHLPAE